MAAEVPLAEKRAVVCFEDFRPRLIFGENITGRGGPDEWLWVGIVGSHVILDRLDELRHIPEDASPDPSSLFNNTARDFLFLIPDPGMRVKAASMSDFGPFE